jgi:signal transduction histidine kinase
MHPSEWNTILQNLYSNSKKAIIRANRVEGKILIRCSKDKEKGLLFLSFYDNGNGIIAKDSESIFKPFFTTSTPSSVNNTLADNNTGTGLGLHILRQIIKNRNGEIKVGTPLEGYNTCMTIQLPLHSLN